MYKCKNTKFQQIVDQILPSLDFFTFDFLSMKLTPRFNTISWNSSKVTIKLQTSRPYAAAAKSLQLCLTLCDPIDSSPPGSPVPGILKARTLEWVASSFSTTNHGKFLKRCEYQSVHLTCLLRNLHAGQEATVRTRHGTKTGSKLGKEYIKAVCCYLAYLT